MGESAEKEVVYKTLFYNLGNKSYMVLFERIVYECKRKGCTFDLEKIHEHSVVLRKRTPDYTCVKKLSEANDCAVKMKSVYQLISTLWSREQGDKLMKHTLECKRKLSFHLKLMVYYFEQVCDFKMQLEFVKLVISKLHISDVLNKVDLVLKLKGGVVHVQDLIVKRTVPLLFKTEAGLAVEKVQKVQKEDYEPIRIC